MINSRKIVEKLLQRLRFNKVKKYLKGDVLDFGGNEGELKTFVKGTYTLVNYDHSPMHNKTFDSIVLLAVIEHIEVTEVNKLFKIFKGCLRINGTLFLTTPTLASKPILELLAFLNILDKKNIEEHKHYWNKKELFALAQDAGFEIKRYHKFQFGFNQSMVLKHYQN
jgi:2-polyprenyl-3-methyl-5-hydroxy-6-metoxy-1,4-benzoquinol methylase